MSNFTSVSVFLLLKLSEVRELQLLHFVVFLILYLAIMTGNLLIIAAVAFDHHLHTPMYFFLMNLAILDLGSVSTTVPKSMANSLLNSQSIAYSGCVAQFFFFLFFEASDLALLTIMAHDRYVAICDPLRYETIMNQGACLQMVASAWIAGLLYAAVHTGSMFSIPFCSNVVNQFFCEIPKLLKITCSDLYLIEVGLVVLGCMVVLGCFIYIILTYVHIFSSVLRNPSKQGKQKAFSTCIPHLAVFSTFVFTGVFAHLRPPMDTSSDQDLAFSLIYTMVPPMMNPIIYSMRNKQLKLALWKLLGV
ncbi:olfactory receptor 14I1-like [Tiliqua scincoides]|uniref:olfactory receptor 14I1-like n=1 Tax=Tiliqua scincoides TaxID=71010 RepID=UPI0034633B71